MKSSDKGFVDLGASEAGKDSQGPESQQSQSSAIKHPKELPSGSAAATASAAEVSKPRFSRGVNLPRKDSFADRAKQYEEQAPGSD